MKHAEVVIIGAGLSISPNGALGLKSLGVSDEFREVAYAPDEQVVRHYKTARVLARVSRGERLEELYGERYYVVHRADLHRVLADAVLLGRAVHEAADMPEALARYEGGRVGRARFVVERSTLQVPRFHSADPDRFRHDVPVDEALGLFGYNPALVPV